MKLKHLSSEPTNRRALNNFYIQLYYSSKKEEEKEQNLSVVGFIEQEIVRLIR